MSYFGVSDAKRRAARTDPPPSLAKKKMKEVRLPKKKFTKSETDLSKKKTAEPKQGYTKHVTDTHKKKYPATRFQTEKWSIKNSNRGRIAETQKEELNREYFWNSAIVHPIKKRNR